MKSLKHLTLTLLGLGALLPIAIGQSTAHRDLVGTWEGKLVVGQTSLRLRLEIARASGDHLTATLYSLDQGGTPIPCSDVALQQDTFSFKVPAVNGSFTGHVSEDGSTIDGTWTQTRSLPLTFHRQPHGTQPPAAAKPAPARPPVSVPDLEVALDEEFRPLLETPVLDPASGIGIVIGVVQDGQRSVLAYGAADPASIFEIGSVTKTFTGLLLAQMVAQHEVALDDPVRTLLPPGTIAKPEGPEITLLDLATQHSGLPRLPDNLRTNGNPADPYAAYGPEELGAYLQHHGLALPKAPTYLYSNLGYGLLGFALARHAGETYGQLVADEITRPLRMTSTGVDLPPDLAARLVPGHDASGTPVPHWTFRALAGAGALRSSAGDLLTYLEAQLHPATAAGGSDGGPGATLGKAIAMTQENRADGPEGMKVGMGWLYQAKGGTYWHDGGTGGFTSFVAFQPDHDRALVVLYNRQDLGASGTPFTQRVAANVLALLSGTPAPPLR